MPQLLHELLDAAAARAPERTAVRHRDQSLTYRQLLQASCRLAGRLQKAGVQHGERVVIVLPNCILLPALLYGCSRIGTPFVLLSEQVPEPVLAHVLDDAEPTLIVGDSTALRKLAADRGLQHLDHDELRTAAAAPEGAAARRGPLPSDLACLIYTSGSTGMPKAVACPHAQMTFAAAAVHSQLRYTATDIIFCPLPLAFDYGLYQLFLCALGTAELHLAGPEESGHRLLSRLRSAQATVLPAVPLLAANLVRLLSRDTTAGQPPPLRLLTNTGAAMPAQLLAELRVRLPDLRVQLMYGLTECKRAAIMPVDEDLHRPDASGRALPGTEIFAVDGNGEPLPPGREGELVVRGPHVMAGYWRRPEHTTQRFRQSPDSGRQLHTGDYGWVDHDGYVHYTGRRDDQYKERGYRVSTLEVQAAACRISGVYAAAVLPPEAAQDGAVLFVESALPPGEVLDRLRGELEENKVPARCVTVEKLPSNANGKVDRSALAQPAGERHG